MVGQVVYKDGSTEPIFELREYADTCEAITPSNKYAHELVVHRHESGFMFALPEFYYYDHKKQVWIRDDSILKFEIYKD